MLGQELLLTFTGSYRGRIMWALKTKRNLFYTSFIEIRESVKICFLISLIKDMAMNQQNLCLYIILRAEMGEKLSQSDRL